MDGASGHRLAIYARSLRACSGSARVVLSLARELVAAGHEVHVHGQRLDTTAVRAAGAMDHRHWSRLLPRQLGRTLLGSRRHARLASVSLRGERYAAVIGDGDPVFQDALLLHTVIRREIEAMNNRPGHRQAAQADWQEAVLRERRWGVVLANSSLMRQELLERYRLPADDVVVIRPGVDAVRFRPDPVIRSRMRKALGLGEGQLLAGFITSGNLPLRGLDTLVELVASLRGAMGDGLRVLAVCSPHNARLLRAAARARGCYGTFLIRPKLAAIEQYLQSLDLLLHPARFETFGLVIAEAAACGCPVVTSEAAGAAELFSGEARAGVVARPTVNALAPVLESLLADPEQRLALARAQATQVRRHSWQRYATLALAALADRQLLHPEVALGRG
jgi:UDP-glucose:(heptosyl)LPS alpha-1,3-glucosyltransferase